MVDARHWTTGRRRYEFFGVAAAMPSPYRRADMHGQATPDHWGLTEREKQTLRLIVRGHDAKSTARRLGLSVHTINERLRDARRKMAVSSSREAARLLLEAEGGVISPSPESFGDARIAEDAGRVRIDRKAVQRMPRRRWMTGGLVMTLLAAMLIVAGSLPTPFQTPATTHAARPSAVTDAAQQWLMLVDQGRWGESYLATGAAFRALNTAKVWADTSERVRTPLGAVRSRTLVSQENLPAPPAGYEVVKFRTSFANKPDATETVTLEQEDGQWRVVGVTIG